jgi:hypothetical protein
LGIERLGVDDEPLAFLGWPRIMILVDANDLMVISSVNAPVSIGPNEPNRRMYETDTRSDTDITCDC